MIKKNYIQSLFFVAYAALFFFLSSFSGYSFRQLSLPNSVTAYVLEIDPQKYAIFPVHAYGRAIGRQTVQEIAKNHQAFAAINGGFFKSAPDGAPAGILKINDKWFGWPTKPRGAIGWSQNGRFVLFDQLLSHGSVFMKVVNHPVGDVDEAFGLSMNRSVSDAIIIKKKE